MAVYSEAEAASPLLPLPLPIFLLFCHLTTSRFTLLATNLEG